MLSRHDYLSIADVIHSAHLVTMGNHSFSLCNVLVYGISELLDFDEPKAEELLFFLAKELTIQSELLIVDPISLEFLNEKEQFIKDTLIMNAQWKEQYHGHDKVSVTRSVIEPYIQSYCNSLHLLINRDIKYSCHTWTMYLSKFSNERRPPQEYMCIAYNCCLILTQSICIPDWVSRIRKACRTNIWTIEDASESNQAIIDRLYRAWRRYGGVLCAPYTRYVRKELLIVA